VLGKTGNRSAVALELLVPASSEPPSCKPSPPRDCKADSVSAQATAASRPIAGRPRGKAPQRSSQKMDRSYRQARRPAKFAAVRFIPSHWSTFNSRARGSGGQNENVSSSYCLSSHRSLCTQFFCKCTERLIECSPVWHPSGLHESGRRRGACHSATGRQCNCSRLESRLFQRWRLYPCCSTRPLSCFLRSFPIRPSRFRFRLGPQSAAQARSESRSRAPFRQRGRHRTS